MGKTFIDFGVAPYALADACEALFKNGVTNGFITKEDNELHIRWEYNIMRGHQPNKNNDAIALSIPIRRNRL